MSIVVLLQVLVDLIAARSDCDRVESEVRARRVGQIYHGAAALVDAGYYERDAERPHPGVLGILLVEVGDLLGDALDVDGLVVDQAVALCDDAGVVNLDPGVGYVSGSDGPDMVI